MSKRTDAVVSGVLVICAILVAAATIHREFTPPPRSIAGPNAPPRAVENWEELTAAGTLIGDPEAPVTILVFVDLECPYCRRFHEALDTYLKEHPRSANVVFVHYPLKSHKFAEMGARAAECANEDDKLWPFVSAVFSQQDSIGLLGWSEFASAAGVSDLSAFERCLERPGLPSRITAGLAAGASIGITGTPTVVINGWRMGAAPFDSIPSVVQNVAAGAGAFRR